LTHLALCLRSFQIEFHNLTETHKPMITINITVTLPDGSEVIRTAKFTEAASNPESLRTGLNCEVASLIKDIIPKL
jgi:hypothetical protein